MCVYRNESQEQIPANTMNSYGSTKFEHLLHEVGYVYAQAGLTFSKFNSSFF